MKRPASTFHHFRQRIPADVRTKAPHTPLEVPVGEALVSFTVSPKAAEVTFSLRTRDPREAKARQAVAMAYLERVWQGLRDGPKRLTTKQAAALAGEAYKVWTEALEDDPLTPNTWAEVRTLNAAARRGDYGLRAALSIGDEGKRRAALEERFGPFVRLVLARHALVTDDESRDRLLAFVADAVDAAAERLARNAEGDYSPDENVRRYPLWEAGDASSATPARLSVGRTWLMVGGRRARPVA